MQVRLFILRMTYQRSKLEIDLFNAGLHIGGQPVDGSLIAVFTLFVLLQYPFIAFLAFRQQSLLTGSGLSRVIHQYDYEEQIWYMYEDDILYLYDDETDTIFYYDEQDDKIYYYDEEIDDWCEVEE